MRRPVRAVCPHQAQLRLRFDVNPPQRGIVRIRSPAKAANVLHAHRLNNTSTACCVSPLSLLRAFNFAANASFRFKKCYLHP